MVEALRSLVGENGWEYCILWKLSQDQRFLEWTGCCCFGSEASIANGGALFPGSASGQKSPCRDMVVPHPRTRSCDALSQFPSSIPLDSSLGIYEHVLISNQPTWLTKPPDCTSAVVDEYEVGAKTRVLVPVQSGLVELFVSKHIAEDQHVIDFVTSQCNSTQGMDGYDYTWIPGMPSEQGNFSWENSMADQSQLYNSPLNLLDGVKNGTGDQVFFDGSAVQAIQQTGNLEMDSCDMAGVAYHRSGSCVGGETAGGQDISKESVKQEAALRADSGSDGTDDDEDPRPTVGRNGKRHHSKNLVAERKRRKKLNDRLYALRALVPKITKMDRASILGDAIEYVMELQKQVKDLQDELEEDTNPEDDETKQIGSNCKLDPPNPNGVVIMSNGMELDESPNSSRLPPANNARASDAMKLQAGHEQSNEDNKGNQMEPQVEVRQVEGNEFFLKVFCEHKAGGFARLMEAMSSLGLEVTNANVTTFRTLVLNVFRVEKREDDLLQVDQVRNSLLEITRGQSGGWPEPAQFVMNGGDYLGTQNQLHYLNHQL